MTRESMSHSISGSVLKKILVAMIAALCSLLVLGRAAAQGITFESNAASFRIADKFGATPLLVAPGEAEVVRISAELFAADVELVTGQKPALLTAPPDKSEIIIVGTLAGNPWIKQLVAQGQLTTNGLAGAWETSRNFLVAKPFPGVKRALVIVGSDRRGAAYGLLELSRQMGVSPWIWWADVTPAKRAVVFYNDTPKNQLGPPSVKFRGIFINDEDWSLLPWIKSTFDPATGNFGPKTYEKVFELMLRLRANYLWPAMHEVSLAFNTFPENAALADHYAIVGGSSHCEPLLQNNASQWKLPHNQWNYFTHAQEVRNFWEAGMKLRGRYENVYTVGMRGIHDSGMPGSSVRKERVRKMKEVFADQRTILEKFTGKPASELPMIFCPYKEVLADYDAGLVVPDDVTICWAEDNQGYVRRMPDAKERARSGGHGIYFHLSYWSDYLWLSSIAPQLMALELSRAYEYDVRRVWIANVGDIKAAEKETQFFLDLAWDIHAWSDGRANQWAARWAADTFGAEFGHDIGHVLNEYYRLAWRGKPEHIGHTVYPDSEIKKRLADYDAIAQQAAAIRAKLPARLQSAYFQLVYYPVVATKHHNDKVLLARMSGREAERGQEGQALAYSRQASAAWEQVKTLTAEYNSQSNGKWKDVMSWHPRDLKVFLAPDMSAEGVFPTGAKLRPHATSPALVRELLQEPEQIFTLNEPHKLRAGKNGTSIRVEDGLSIDGRAAYLIPNTSAPIPADQAGDAPAIEFNLRLTPGAHRVRLKFLPSFAITRERQLRCAVSFNDHPPEVKNVEHKETFHNFDSCTWTTTVVSEPCLDGYVAKDFNLQTTGDGETTLRIALLDPALVFYRAEILSLQP